MSAAYWREPLKWNRAASERGERERVFPSICDPFDAEAPEGTLDRFWGLVEATQNLDWLLLTKRPERITQSLPKGWDKGWPNVWVLTSVEDQETADKRIPQLIGVPAVVHGLSIEPLLGPINFFAATPEMVGRTRTCEFSAQNTPFADYIQWGIVGGESGAQARSMNVTWVRQIAGQFEAARVPLFTKQFGQHVIWDGHSAPGAWWPSGTRTVDTGLGHWRVHLRHHKGGNPEEWPGGAAAWPRQFPEVRR